MIGGERIQSLVRKIATRSDPAWFALNVARRARIRIRDLRMPIAYGIHNIELTNKCPMRCVMCPRTTSMTREQGLMSFDLFRSIVDQIANDTPRFAARRVIWLHHFGESLVHPEFARFMQYGASRGLRLGLSLNPIMLAGAVADQLLATDLDAIVVSLDGHDNESFEKIRGIKDAFDKSKDNLIRFLERKTESRWKTRVVVSMINFGRNRNSIAEIQDFWSNLPGVDEFLTKKFVTFNGDVESVSTLEGDLTRMRKAPFVVCSRPWDMMTVTWDGDVVPCCYDYDKKYVLGSLKNSTLSAIWMGERMKALREEFLSNHVTNPLCKSCPSLCGDIVSEGS